MNQKPIVTPRLVFANLGLRPWMRVHLAHSFYAWPKTIFIHRKHILEPDYGA